jgi:hypothetical protein
MPVAVVVSMVELGAAAELGVLPLVEVAIAGAVEVAGETVVAVEPEVEAATKLETGVELAVVPFDAIMEAVDEAAAVVTDIKL